VEKLELLNTSEERTRIMNEVLEVHVDSHMDPEYDSAEEMEDTPAGIYLLKIFFIHCTSNMLVICEVVFSSVCEKKKFLNGSEVLNTTNGCCG
jgi:hypothetical protein